MQALKKLILNIKKRKIAASVGAFVGILLFAAFIQAPYVFPQGGVITIKEGTTVTETAQILEQENIIRSSGFFGLWVRLFGGGQGILSETYEFKTKLNVFQISNRLTNGITGTPLIRVTLPEGSTARSMALILKDTIPNFDTDAFTALATEHEGYLFPETYLFSPHATAEVVIETMRTTFDTNIASIQSEVDTFGAPLEEVVIMASLLEREARQFETKQMIAGILWKRIEIGMALQVDAVFGYILETETFSPTFDQLDIDSPYNTYKNAGLPPGAIANPGLESLRAAVTPKKSPYLFYLTGVDGRMYYAENFDQHVANRRFLR